MPEATRINASTETKAPATNAVSSGERTAAGFADHRDTAVAQRQLSSLVAHSPRVTTQRQQAALMRGARAPGEMAGATAPAPVQAKADPGSSRTGLPGPLKAGIENLSGMRMDHVKVHYNSARPAQLKAHAYAQGSEIHVAPGQERHLPHEAWHVVQQAQGRVKPTMQMKGEVAINDDAGLESEADVMGQKALGHGPAQLAGNAGGPAARPPAAPAGPRSWPVAQLVARRSKQDHRHEVRERIFKEGSVDKAGWSVLDLRIGATNIVEAGIAPVKALLGGGLTPLELAAVFAGVDQANVAGMFAHAGPSVALYRRLAASHPGLIEDFFAHPAPAAPTAEQIATWYGNYLHLPGHPVAYDNNAHGVFSTQMTGPPRRYRDFAAAAWGDMVTAYDAYVRHNAGANLRMNAYAAEVYANGLAPNNATGVPAAIPHWDPNAGQTATHAELGLAGQGLRQVTAQYTPEMNRAIHVSEQNAAAVTNLAGAHHDGRMRTVLSILSQHPHANTLAALQVYVNVFGQNVINNGARLSPFRVPTWENAFATALNASPHRPAVVAWISGNADARLPAMRATFAHADPAPAPNFAPIWALVGQVVAQNPGQLNHLLEHLSEVRVAAAHQNAMGLAFSNRAGGLRGHFKKHVLGQGNIDAGEPAAWMTELHLVGNITRAQLGALSAAEEQTIFQRWFVGVRSAVAAGTVLDQVQVDRVIAQVQAGAMAPVAEALAGHYEHLYAARVGHAYDTANASYLMYDTMPKIIAWKAAGARGIFTISGLVAGAGAFDLSSGYMPSATAVVKFNAGYAQRFWDV